MPPQIPTLRPAVQQNDQRTRAFDDGSQADAVGFDHLKIGVLHNVPSWERARQRWARETEFPTSACAAHLHPGGWE
jgi:hypothetical protein